MRSLPYIAQRLFNTPLALHPRKCEIVIAALAERMGVASLTRLNGETIRPVAFWDDDDDDGFTRAGNVPDPGYDLVEGVAVIQVHGTLVQKLGGARPFSGMTGFDQIRAAVLCAVEDVAAKAIVLDIDSGGGEVAGCFDLADEIFFARGTKPIHAILNEMAYSAAYAIASAADRVYVPRTGGTGSVGVMCAHVDFSQALTGAGIKVTFIQYGDQKTDGASEKPLSRQALAHFQADVDTMGEMFVDLIARNRGLSRAAVRATEARTYLGADGVVVGFADAVMAPDAAFRDLKTRLA